MLARPETLLVLLAGVALLFAGRRLFWLFIGVVGFAAGLQLSHQTLGAGVSGRHWLVAIGAGVLGALLALFLQRAAIALAGFFLGGYGAALLLGIDPRHAGAHGTALLLCLAAGVIAALLALRLFDGALIVLSAFAGAGLIVDALHLGHRLGGLWGAALLLLTAVGIAVQAGLGAGRIGRTGGRAGMAGPGTARGQALRGR